MVGCSNGPQCVVDTHCDIGQRCEDRHCVGLGGTDAGGDSAPPDDAGMDAADSAVDSAVMDSAVDTGPDLDRVGFVVAESDQVDIGTGTAVPQYAVSAFFSESEPSVCVVTTEGACKITACPDETPPMMDGGVGDGGTDAAMDAAVGDGGMDGGDAAMMDAEPPPPLPNAGAINVNGGVLPITLAVQADGTYMPASAALQLWSDGMTTMQFMAIGDEVPNFNVVQTSTQSVSITAPDLGAVPLLVTRSADMPLTWSGPSPGNVVVRLVWRDVAPSTANTTVECSFPVADGSGSIPTAALTMLPASSVGTFQVTVENPLSVEGTEPWDITVMTRSDAVHGSNLRARVDATFE